MQYLKLGHFHFCKRSHARREIVVFGYVLFEFRSFPTTVFHVIWPGYVRTYFLVKIVWKILDHSAFSFARIFSFLNFHITAFKVSEMEIFVRWNVYITLSDTYKELWSIRLFGINQIKAVGSSIMIPLLYWLSSSINFLQHAIFWKKHRFLSSEKEQENNGSLRLRVVRENALEVIISGRSATQHLWLIL